MKDCKRKEGREKRIVNVEREQGEKEREGEGKRIKVKEEGTERKQKKG